VRRNGRGTIVARIPDRDPATGWLAVRDVPSRLRGRVDEAERATRNAAPGGSDRECEDAVLAWQRVMEGDAFAAAPLTFRLDAMNRHAVSLMFRGMQLRRLSDIERAEAGLRTALALAPAGFSGSSRYTQNLGLAAIYAFDVTGDAAWLDVAVDHCAAAIELGSADAEDVALFFSTLGFALGQRFGLAGDIGDLERAVAALTEAVARVPGDSIRRPAHLNTLATRLRMRYERQGSPDDLALAIELLEESLRTTAAGSPATAYPLTNLGNCLLERHRATLDEDDLHRAIGAFEAAVRLTAETDSKNLAVRLNNLGNGLIERFRLAGDREDLRRALDAYSTSLTHTGDEDPDLASRHFNIANAWRDHHQLTGDGSDLNRGIAAYQRACVSGLDGAVGWALQAASSWSEWAFQRRSWAEAASAGEYGLTTMDRVLRVQLVREHKEIWIRAAEGIPARTAYALAEADRLQDAVAALERGRALLLSEALERDRADLEQLATSGRGDLLRRYREAAMRLDGLSRPDSPNREVERRFTQLQDARRELESIVEDIRTVPGYERFLDVARIEDVVRAAKTAPLVYLATTGAGGLGLVVDRTGSVARLWLPGLTESALRGKVRDHLLEYDRRSSDGIGWLEALDELTRWLWDVLMRSVLQALQPAERATVIAGGLLGLLPLHAAWAEDQDRPGGRVYVMDTILLSYAPNARALREGAQHAGGALGPLLAVGNPQPVRGDPLPHSEDEVQALTDLFEESTVLTREAARRSTVMDALAGASVLHFSCHGFTDLSDPLRSGLALAGDEVLTLKDLMEWRRHPARLAVLSACETALSGTEVPDETVGFPTALLQAGFGGVVGTQWSVPDFSTMMLMVVFYQGWRVEGLEPAEALRAAQRWLRDTTNGEKQARFPRTVTRAAEDVPRAARNFWESARAHAHPYHWAAFAYVGN
jgi:CHAT domain-containing protein/tetratricopeptide (TPR) repeat protein